MFVTSVFFSSDSSAAATDSIQNPANSSLNQNDGAATLANNSSIVAFTIWMNPNRDFGDLLNATGTVKHDFDDTGNEEYNISVDITTNNTTSSDPVVYDTIQAGFESGNTEAYFFQIRNVDTVTQETIPITLEPGQTNTYQIPLGGYTGFLLNDSNSRRLALHITLYNGNTTVGNFHTALPTLYGSLNGQQPAELILGNEEPLLFDDYFPVEAAVNTTLNTT